MIAQHTLTLTVLLVVALAAAGSTDPVSTSGDPRDLIVVTDVEPDDMIALQLLNRSLSKKNYSSVHIVVSHKSIHLKKAILLETIPRKCWPDHTYFYLGKGGKTDNLIEGTDIIPDEAERKRLQLQVLTSPSKWHDDFMNRILNGTRKIDLVALAPTDDIDFVLNHGDIGQLEFNIFAMGGHFNNFATFNWSESLPSAQLMVDTVKSNQSQFQFHLVSSHVVKNELYPDGTLCANNSMVLAKTLFNRVKNPLIVQGIRNWNTHIVKKRPSLNILIGDKIDTQFTPADPLTMYYALFSDESSIKQAYIKDIVFDAKVNSVIIHMAEQDQVTNMLLLTDINKQHFEETLAAAFEPKKSS